MANKFRKMLVLSFLPTCVIGMCSLKEGYGYVDVILIVCSG